MGVAAPGRAGAQADVEARLPPPHGLALLDVFITNPRATIYVAGATARQGSAADHEKLREHNGHQHLGYSFIPAYAETYGYLGKPLASYIKTVSEVAAGRGPAVTKGSFLASTHRGACSLTGSIVSWLY